MSGTATWKTLLASLVAVAAAFLVAAVLLSASGHDPARSLARMFLSAFGSRYALAQTMQQMVPILLCAIGIAYAARLGLWNIGAEGQLYMGALATVGVYQYFPDLPAFIMIPAMALAGICAGALWILVPALLRAYGGVSEILTTLMLNYVAVPITNYFLYGPWKSPTAFNFPVTNRFGDNAVLPYLPGFPVHAGLLVALLLAVLLDQVLWRSAPGFRVRAAGDNRNAAIYAGYPIRRMEVMVFCLAGALAGLAGMIQVTGVTHQLLPNISPNFGYLGIIVAALALISIRGCVVVSFFLAAILVGSKGMETIGVPSGIANFLAGLLLLFALIGVAISFRGDVLAKGRRRAAMLGKEGGGD